TFWIDRDKNQLWEQAEDGHSQRVWLSSFYVRVLIMFIDHRHEPLSVEQLGNAFWHGTTASNVVQKAIGAIRRALRDSAKPQSQIYIKTMGRGEYRWIYRPINVNAPTPQGRRAFLADCALIVIRAITSAWDLETLLSEKGYYATPRPVGWHDSLFGAFEEGDLDFAIYNTARTLAYLEDRRRKRLDTKVVRLGDAFASMDGQHTYVLAKRGSRWLKPLAPSDLKQDLLTHGGTIAVPHDNDMRESLFMCLGCNPQQGIRGVR